MSDQSSTAITPSGHVPYADDLRGDWMLYLDGEIAEGQMQATVDYVAQHVAGLRSLLAEAIEDIEHWGAYAGDYFQEKWDLAGDLAKYRAALAVDDGGASNGRSTDV